MRKETQPLLKHIFQISEEGEEDSEWIEKLDKGDCIVISGDQGRDIPRLPSICKQKNITHIVLSPNVHKSSRFERARAIIALWPHILKTFNAPPGSRFLIKQNSTKDGYILKQVSKSVPRRN